MASRTAVAPTAGFSRTVPRAAPKAFLVFVAGDSAGGNLTLSLLSWIRDEGLRRPDAGSRCRRNGCGAGRAEPAREHRHRPMLGPAFGKLARVPQILLLWYQLVHARACAHGSPRIAGARLARGAAAGAGAGQRFGDAPRRCASLRRQGAGGGVAGVLQTWPNMLHVWQMFPDLPEAEEAYAEDRRVSRRPRGARGTASRRHECLAFPMVSSGWW
jgi:monoterpene epsilon-lactone hydrolase